LKNAKVDNNYEIFKFTHTHLSRISVLAGSYFY
jgi:hypothetical protein